MIQTLLEMGIMRTLGILMLYGVSAMLCLIAVCLVLDGISSKLFGFFALAVIGLGRLAMWPFRALASLFAPPVRTIKMSPQQRKAIVERAIAKTLAKSRKQ